MYVVTVTFTVEPAHVDDFRAAVCAQAQASLEREKDCHQFDVAVDPDAPEVFFLYERYTDRTAFEAHLQTPHFKTFDARVTGWSRAKTVRSYEGVWP